MTVPPGSTLRVVGDEPFIVLAEALIHIEGTVDASGFKCKSVFSLLSDPRDAAAIGGPGGGTGGTGYPGYGKVVPGGGMGSVVLFPDAELQNSGGGGGETGYGPTPIAVHHRGGGGGGGAFAPGVVGGGPGLGAARARAPGDPLALGAWSGLPVPAGGAAGTGAFSDGNPLNDFFGLKLDPATGAVLRGELAHLRGGGGGGGSGESVASPFFVPGSAGGAGPYRYFKNGGGGGGGGIVVLSAKRIKLAGPGLACWSTGAAVRAAATACTARQRVVAREACWCWTPP